MMNKRNITWNDLYKYIGKMSEDERATKVLIWSEEDTLSNSVTLCKEREDLVYNEENPEEGCYLRSDHDGDDEPILALKAGTFYLYNEKELND